MIQSLHVCDPVYAVAKLKSALVQLATDIGSKDAS